MNRREVLVASAIGITVPLSGCLFGRSSTVESKERPEFPDELDDQSAIQFGKEYEEAFRHNERIQNTSEIVDLQYDCYAAVELETKNLFYVVVQCAFSFEARDEGGRSVGEGITDPTLYFLTKEEFIRAETEHINARSPTDSANDRHRGVRLVNFSEEEQTVAIEIRSASSESESSETQFSGDYSISPQKGLTIERVARDDGIYIVTVTTNNETSVTHQWEVPGQDGPNLGDMWSSTGINLGAYILPNGELEVRDIPES